MPLITCPDCHQVVSDLAPACPHCGRPVTPQSSARFSSSLESASRAFADVVGSTSQAILTAFLVPLGCLVWIFLGGLGGCVALFSGGGAPPRPAPTPARVAPRFPSSGFWLSADGGSRNLGSMLSTCRVDTVTVLRQPPFYDTSGRPTYPYVVHVDVYNHTGTPTGPRVTVWLYDQTGRKKESSAIAYSLDSDLQPGSTKRFTDRMTAPFVAAWVDIKDSNR